MRFTMNAGRYPSGFDARTILNTTKRIRSRKTGIQRVMKGVRKTSGNAGRIKMFTDFTVVAAVTPDRRVGPRVNKLNSRLSHLIEPKNRMPCLPSRTIENSQVSISRMGMSKTFVNPNRGSFFDASYPEEDEEPELSVRVRNVNGRPVRMTGNKDASSAMFLHAMRQAQMDQTPYEPSLVTKMHIDEPIRLKSARDRLGPPTSANKPEGFRVIITNLAASVSADDVQELCSSVSGLIESRLIESGLAEATYISKKTALEAVKLYDDRQLDGVPMRLQLTGERQELKKMDEKPTNLRVKEEMKNDTLNKPIIKPEPMETNQDVDRDLITSALFPLKKNVPDSSRVTFTVKI